MQPDVLFLLNIYKRWSAILSSLLQDNIKKLLQNEFPGITFLNLPGYKISYSKNKRLLPLKILIQLPKILKIIRYEHKWLYEIIDKYRFDAIISDNRYGLYTNMCTAVFITHQLKIQTNISWLDKILQQYNYSFINRFSECWIPDFKGKLNIAGALSQPEKMPAIEAKYLGPLSRFEKNNEQILSYKWMVVVSGPEPQRSIFEKKIFEAATKTNDSFLIVRGLPGNQENNFKIPNCKIYNHLNTAEMQEAMEASEFIISRCGYTTIMEILSLQKKSVLIPTPGQTEQEYLAKHLSTQNWCYTFTQDNDFALHLAKG